MSSNETIITHTTCPYCGVGCGVEVSVQSGGDKSQEIKVKGDKSHPANLGRLCSKGAALGETLDLDGRLLFPVVNHQQTDWEAALQYVADGLRSVIEKHGPDAVAFYVSGQLLTEDYYVANKLMKGFIGSANIDTNSRLCMSSSVVGHKRAFGSDTVPCSYTDLEAADLIVLVGSNTAWCHPVLFQRLRQAKKDRPQTKIVVVDPRKTETCDIADLHLALSPGSDIALFNGLLAYLEQAGQLDKAFISQHTEGFAEALEKAKTDAGELSVVAESCDLGVDELKSFYQWFSETPNTVTVYSQGVNQWSCGTDKVNAIINCHLAAGRIGKPGQGPFSFTGQPNAMGGREVGGLANQLAAHMDFSAEEIETVREFWAAPAIASKPGYKAVDLFSAIDAGKVKAVWVMATNPAVSLPEVEKVEAALKKCELVIVSDCVADTDTAKLAHVLLPAATWGEKDGTVTNSERRISRQRSFLPAPGDARPDWWIVSEVAKRMGFEEAFAYHSPVEIWCEHAALSGFKNQGQRDFDVSELSEITETEYQQLKPRQWPFNKNENASLFVDGKFFHANNKARFIAVDSCADLSRPDDKFPLILNTGRVRDQWHTMTRTGKVARLSRHRAEPYVEMHPNDAARFQLVDEQLARISSRTGSMFARVSISERQKPGNIFIPMHWNDSFSKDGKVGPLVNALTDPYSGQPQFKHTPVKISAAPMKWNGFLLTKNPEMELPFDYWVKRKNKFSIRYDIAGANEPTQWSDLVRQVAQDGGDWVEFHDQAGGNYRAARIKDEQLCGCIFVTQNDDLPDDDWLDSLFANEVLGKADRVSLLAGRPAVDVKAAGKTICACFNVGLNTIKDAIKEQKLMTVDDIGRVCQAGTNCGSCIPELEEILKELA